jgi:hypothetical protein
MEPMPEEAKAVLLPGRQLPYEVTRVMDSITD